MGACLGRRKSPAFTIRPISKEVGEFIRRGGGRIEVDTVLSPGSLEAALLAAGAVRDAVGRVVGGEDTTALCLVRPPGHHALPAAAMGFCLFNNVAIGARMAVQELQLDRVLVVDWDVHHGNGTQESFWRDEQIGFLSIHRWPFYPGTGDADETGSGPGLGTTLNLPVPFGTPRAEYLARFTGELNRLADRIKPQLVIISAGFDSHRTDPVGSLGLETEDFATLTQAVRAVADQHAGGRIVSVLEGGYNPPVLAECVGLHLAELQMTLACPRLFCLPLPTWPRDPWPLSHAFPSRRCRCLLSRIAADRRFALFGATAQ